MSDWYFRIIAITAIAGLTCVSYLYAEDHVKKLPFCNPNTVKDTPLVNDLIIVSTLDGRITAFVTSSGNKAWDIQTQPLLSSNLHHVELTAGGKWVRLVPSLRGTLYSLSGETIEPLPFDAEQLLSSSFKYSDDLVIAGARESSWMGVDASSGGVMYQCGSAGCSSEQQTARADRDVIVLRRNSNVVRAIEPRSGTEKWNFSVAEHQLALSNSRECLGEAEHGPDYNVAVALPEGMVAVRHGDSPQLIWQQKLDSPVAGMWRLTAGTLQNIDILWAATKAISAETYVQMTPPSLYIGLHNQQLYVQESLVYIQKTDTAVVTKPTPWKLKHSRPLITGPNSAVQNLVEPDSNTLSLIALYGNNGQTGNQGFFLYTEDTCDQSIQVTEDMIGNGNDILSDEYEDYPSEHHHVHVHVYSLWFWWKEVLLIAISSALLMNLMIWPRFFAPRFRPSTPMPVNQDVIVVERHYERPTQSMEYAGRFENDFTMLRCLGRGGFGVVFESRNNIDHCSYAVKRITLPRRESKRDRVLREVRALAKLEHEHIVRYFNAWLEDPPPNWQEARDTVWMRDLDGVSVAMSEEYTSQKETRDTQPPSSLALKSFEKPDNVMLNLQTPEWEKSVDACFDAMEYDKQVAYSSKRNRSFSCNDSFSIVFDNDANDVSVVSKNSQKHSADLTSDLTVPNDMKMSKNLHDDDNDDSFIVFANSEDDKSIGLSEARNYSVSKQMENVRECDSFCKTSETSKRKHKKGHTRHWSLDICVKERMDKQGHSQNSSKMYLYIQMQLCLRDSLHDWLRQNRTYQARREKAKNLFSQILSAVEYVHLAGLIHRDLKPSNIFFAPDGKVKVGDFGLVTTMMDSSQDGDNSPQVKIDVQTRHTKKVGTHLYMSPEQLQGHPYSYKVDIYSLGLILFELLQPFNTESERINCLLRLREGEYPQTFQENYSKEMDVLKLMLSKDPEQRPTAVGVRARAPLYHHTNHQWHFSLPRSP